jgi:cob(I)alamin adenosyltransferase
VQWSRDHDVRPELLQYINRLSDLLFVIGRVIEADNNQTTTLWEKNLALPQPE